MTRLMRVYAIRGVGLRRRFVATTQRDERQRPAPDWSSASSPPKTRPLAQGP
jgi:hypothetical protein